MRTTIAINDTTDHSVVVDPTETEVNQIYARYKGLPDTTLTYGRQRFALDNHRFIGVVGWRQNEQTFDAFIGANESLDTTITAGYLYNADRYSRTPARMALPSVADSYVQYRGCRRNFYRPWISVRLYHRRRQLSTQNFGLRFTGGTDVTEDAKVCTPWARNPEGTGRQPAALSCLLAGEAGSPRMALRSRWAWKP